jgi:UDP-N-acetylmuramoylalanine--D-glutamate ligase
MAVARYLAAQEVQLFVSDCNLISDESKRELNELMIPWEEGQHSARAHRADLIITSPGVASDAPVLQKAQSFDIPIWSEIELAYRVCPSSYIIAVTGTVGKTTTSHLISELFNTSGYHVVLAGNSGTPFISLVEKVNPGTVIVLEVSSYQLEHVDVFSPLVGVLTRFAPHHLQRHGSVENYLDIKSKLFKEQSPDDFAIVHAEIELPNRVCSNVISFDGDVLSDEIFSMPEHQRENISAAILAASALDPSISLDQIDLEAAIKLPHRLEFVTTINEMSFYNDSKATTPEATCAALRAFSEDEVVLILGGSDSEGDSENLVEEIKSHNLSQIYLLGESSDRYSKLLKKAKVSNVKVVSELSAAVEGASNTGASVCLFSPASPSFDEYENYEARGEFFKEVLRSHASKTTIT